MDWARLSRTTRPDFWGAALGHFSINYGFYFVMTWLPTFLRTERGLSILDSTGYLAVLISGSFCGYLSGGFLAVNWLAFLFPLRTAAR